jgi:hypothetical protein
LIASVFGSDVLQIAYELMEDSLQATETARQRESPADERRARHEVEASRIG